MQPIQNRSGNRLSDQCFYRKRNRKIARPFVEKWPDWFHAQMSATDPRADYSHENRHQENCTQDIHNDVRIETIAFFYQFAGHPLSRFVRNQNECDNAAPNQRNHFQDIHPYLHTESHFKERDQWCNRIYGND